MAQVPYSSSFMVRNHVGAVRPGSEPDPRWSGARIHVRLCEGHASHGYQTDYQRRPQRWVQVLAFSPQGKCLRQKTWAFYGRRMPKSEEAYAAALTDAARYADMADMMNPDGSRKTLLNRADVA